MELLDEGQYGHIRHAAARKSAKPTIKKGPFIVVSGHDLSNLAQLLEQTAGKGHQHLHAQRNAARRTAIRD